MTFYWCDGCDSRAITTSTETHWLKRYQDFFSAARLLSATGSVEEPKQERAAS